MATKRNQAKRTGGNGTPGWVWLIAGLILGAVLLMVFVPGAMKKPNADDFFHANTPKPNADAKPAPSDDSDDAPVAASASKSAPAVANAAKPTQYEFYDALTSGKEVVISDADLAKRTRDEAAAAKQRQQALDADHPPVTPSAVGAPKPLDETAAANATTSNPNNATPQAQKTVASAATADGAHYLLQAGAFGASGDAEALKAKIAFLGLNARVESAEANGKTVYRVRMGPYGSAGELSDAKQKLASGGLPAIAIKAQ